MHKKVNLKAAAQSWSSCVSIKRLVLNNNALSVVNVENRTLDFHIHEASDELFHVIEGGFHLKTDEGLAEVNEGELMIVPMGIRHRPAIKGLTRFLLMEPEGTLSKENGSDSYEA